jgi:hypothetical protein
VLVGLLLACRPHDSEEPPPHVYPLDDVLRMNQVQVKGTHNSYHVRPTGYVNQDWDYSHLPLDQQLDAGVRQFELDLHWDEAAHEHGVWHITALDDLTTCTPLVACLQILADWSDRHPQHQPLLLLMEPGGESSGEQPAGWRDDLVAEVLSVWPAPKLITPADVQGSSPTLRDALPAGWPALGDARGRMLAWVDVGGEAATLLGRPGDPLFLQDLAGDERTAVGNHNTPSSDQDAITADIAAGRLVRTMSDPDRDGVLANDRTEMDLALALGAHAISTDHPLPEPGLAYHLELPGDLPWRCNPITAPADCTPEDVEVLP